MDIVIVGAGAMGCLFGAHLARSGNRVTLVDVDRATVRALKERGVRLHRDGGVEEVPVGAASPDEPVAVPALVLVFVKTPHTRSALPAVRSLLGPETRVLTLQNGLGAAEVLAEAVPPGRLLVGTTAQGATLLGPGEVRHGGRGDTVLGPYRGPDPFAAAVAGVLTGAGLPARAVDDPWPWVWRKLAVNCAINPVTALTGIRNGPVAEIPHAAALVFDVVEEVARTARACGVDLGDPRVLGEQVLGIARATAPNRSSMGQDVDRRARTEIDYINGAVVREAGRRGVDVPVNRTLWRLIRTLEVGYGIAPSDPSPTRA